MIDKGGFGHSQEVVRSASGHMGLATARGGIKLKARRGKEKKVRRQVVSSERYTNFVAEELYAEEVYQEGDHCFSWVQKHF